MVTNSYQLNYYMRYKHGFLGTYPRDYIPKLRNGECFIVNTDTSNLGGRHWIGIIKKNGKIYYFDPLGWVPLSSICRKLSTRKIYYQTDTVQNINDTRCGEHVVFYLYNNIHAITDKHAICFINKYLI